MTTTTTTVITADPTVTKAIDTSTTQDAAEGVAKNETMKAIQVHEFVSDFGSVDDTKMSLNDSVPKPNNLQKNQMLIKVLACSISPGDVITVHGNLIFLHEPFPFVPGMDVCGIVEDPNGCPDFQKGDIVVAANGVSAVGGMAEYMAISVTEAVKKPPSVGIHEAAASSSAITARNAVMDNIVKGDRVLILGGSGGVGSAAIQIAKKHAGASYIATTSTQEAFCKELGADKVINYKKENWWEMEWEQKFDKIIDTVGGGNFYGRAEKVLKSGKKKGAFVAVCGDDPKPDCRTVWKAVKFFARMPWRPLYTWLRRSKYPTYVMIMPYDVPEGRKTVLGWMENSSLKIPLDSSSPFPFTAKGVQQAFQTVASGHAHGKVVVLMEKSYMHLTKVDLGCQIIE